MTRSAFTTTPLTPGIGAAMEADVAALLSGELATHVRAVLDERGVILFPEINLTDRQQVTFTETLGVTAEQATAKDGIFKVSMDPAVAVDGYAGYLQASFYWHIDGTANDVPIRASIMSARGVSPTGGQTEFSNTYAAYDALSDADKAAVETLKVVHSFEAFMRYVTPEPSYAELLSWRAHPTKTLPLVWTHQSGRKSLLVGNTAGYVEGLSHDDSFELLVRLRDHATQPQFVYRHEWKLGDMVIWDNTGTMHRAIRYPFDSGRLMHRTKLAGEEVVA